MVLIALQLPSESIATQTRVGDKDRCFAIIMSRAGMLRQPETTRDRDQSELRQSWQHRHRQPYGAEREVRWAVLADGRHGAYAQGLVNIDRALDSSIPLHSMGLRYSRRPCLR